MAAHVLVVDDDRSIRRTLEKLLQSEGYHVDTAADGRAALAAIPAADLVLLDLGLPEVDGFGVLTALHDMAAAPPVIVVTARDDMKSTVKAIQLGAFDYLVKPLDIDRLKLVVRRAIESRDASRALSHLVAQAQSDYQVGNIIGKSPAIREIYKAIGAVSVSRTSVLIAGESGTGKELVAKAIHYASEDRERPFVAVNCTAFAHGLLESELFGHVRGAFTGSVADKIGRFELAGQGTLFLDEVAEIPIDLQAKLLRVLQERSFERVGDSRSLPLKARIVAATHRDLGAMVAAGTFREDLLYRLKVVEIHIPPLRERPEDIPLLAEALLAKVSRELHKGVRALSPEAMTALTHYPWPGNVRELENMLTRAVVLAKSDVLDLGLLPLGGSSAPRGVEPLGGSSGSAGRGVEPLGGSSGSAGRGVVDPLGGSSGSAGRGVVDPLGGSSGSAGRGVVDPLGGSSGSAGRGVVDPLNDATLLPLREVEKRHIEGVLRHTDWNKRRACALLEISRPTLDRKIEEYALRRE